ncbi:MAG: peptidylprolyl isomerase [Verrucomicrobiales bacterium]|jgi:peptidyl-prolyl cis-trans isomerase B (cyclophilin B)|nr:peptidylprolyl isomerase [Verrucomicrobiales bacterium]
MCENTNPTATIETTKGEISIELWADVAPGTVENFTKLANDGFYDGTCFHRIMAGFMIQGGDPQTKDESLENLWGTGDPGYKIKAEFNDRLHVRGVISMARSADPDSAGSQFFVCLGDADFLNGQYTAFGQLSGGDDALGDIGDTPVGPSGSGENSKPMERVEVTSIRVA